MYIVELERIPLKGFKIETFSFLKIFFVQKKAVLSIPLMPWFDC